jgi:hypothetical protein
MEQPALKYLFPGLLTTQPTASTSLHCLFRKNMNGEGEKMEKYVELVGALHAH